MSLRSTIGAGRTGLEFIRAMQDDSTRLGMALTLDISVESADEGVVMLVARPGPHLENTNGVAQGGYAASLLDMAAGYAVTTTLPVGKACPTLELKTAYHKAILLDAGPVRCEGKVVTRGGRVAFAEARLTDAQGALLASGSGTFLIVDARA